MLELRFGGLEFEILWSAYGRDRLPYPLQFRPDAADFDDLKRQREAAVDTLLDKYADELPSALEVLLNPEARVESKGFGGPELSHTFRFHGAVQGELGVALTQLPGTTPDTGGEVILRYCPAGEVARYAMKALPNTPAGTKPPLEIPRADLTEERERPIRHTGEPSVIARLNGVFRRERHGLGEITVYPGPAVDARPAFGRGFWWMDYPDGRYYVQTGDPIIAQPMAAPAMAAEIARLTTLTQRYHREDREHDEYLRSQR